MNMLYCLESREAGALPHDEGSVRSLLTLTMDKYLPMLVVEIVSFAPLLSHCALRSSCFHFVSCFHGYAETSRQHLNVPCHC